MNKISPKKRQKARRFIVQALYQWQMADASLNELLVQFISEMNRQKTDVEYFESVLRQIVRQVSDLDAMMQPFLDRDIKELGPVEHAVLRLGCYELSQRIDVPYKVVLNEAVELAKVFGPEESHKYINGVLDKVVAETRAIELSAAR